MQKSNMAVINLDEKLSIKASKFEMVKLGEEFRKEYIKSSAFEQ
jgi:hypothetical protein